MFGYFTTYTESIHFMLVMGDEGVWIRNSSGYLRVAFQETVIIGKLVTYVSGKWQVYRLPKNTQQCKIIPSQKRNIVFWLIIIKSKYPKLFQSIR